MTPVNGSTVTGDTSTIELYINNPFLSTLSRQRDGTNFPIYDSGLLLLMNFDKVTSMGEYDWLVKDFSIYGMQ